MTFVLAFYATSLFRSALADVPSSPVATSAEDAAGDARYSAFARCSVLSIDEATQLLGYDVLPADATAKAGGNCFFASQALSQDGSVFYALVTAARLVALRPYFTALARRCAGVPASSPRAAGCAMYRKLAAVRDVEGYFAARTDTPDAAAVPGLGVGAGATGAVSAGGTLFVRRGPVLLEAAVRRDGAFDLERSEALARTLLHRLPA